MKRKTGIVFNVFVALSMLLGMIAAPGLAASSPEGQTVPAAPVTQGDAAAKIDPQVLTEIAESGTTEFFVWMVEKADLSPAANLKTKLEKGQFVFNALRETAERTQKDLRAYLSAQGVDYQAFYIANKILVRSGGELLAMDLAARPDVAEITPNHKFQLQEPFIDLTAPQGPAAIEPNITFIRAPEVWALGVTGQGTVMAGNDTGLDWDHPALINQYRGWDGVTADHNYNWWDATGAYPMVPGDGHGHGTHTTGTMVGDDGGDNQIGVAPGAQTVHCKNMTDGGSGDDGTFTTCFQWDLAPWDLSGANPLPSMAPDAINNSWGYWGGNQPQFEDEIAALQAAGIVVEVSAGNEGSSCYSLRSPGDYDQVVTTGSVNHASGVLPGTLTGFSSRGPSDLYPADYMPDVMAPGENIRSSVPGGGYQGGWSGTSMSGPHTTALVGLMWAAAPALRGQVETTYQIMQDTAVPLTGQPGSSCGGDYTEGPNNDWGFGTIDAMAAVQMAIAMGGAGALDGTVTDAITGLPINAATVTALHEEGFSWDVMTNASGYYTVTVATGTYDVTASHPQYMSSTVSGVEVITDTVTTQDLELTPRGWAYGYVTDLDNGFPLVGATVTADDGTTATTDDSGYYEMWLDPGTYDLTADMQDYAPETAVGVVIVSGAGTMQDFALEAAISFSPSPLTITLDYGDTGSIFANLANRQPWDYNFEFKEREGEYIPAVNIPRYEGEIPVSTEPSSTGRPPTAPAPAGAEAPSGIQLPNGAGAYALDVYPGYNLVNFPDVDVPGTWNIVASVPQFHPGADFLNGDFSKLYAVEYYSNEFVAIDTATGARTVIGYTSPSGSWTGLSGSSDGILYGMSSNCGTNSTLYTIDPGSGALTTIGNVRSGSCIIDIAINADGEMYGVDIIDDSLYQIDTATGVGTYVGSTGVSANYAQGMDFEEETGILYWAAYTYSGEMRIIDTNTGNSVLVGGFPGGAEVDGLSFATGGAGANVPWFGMDPTAGTVPGEGDLDVTAYFSATYDAGIYQPGDYLGTLKVDGESGQPDVNVPVVMTVNAPENWGKIEGTVTGLGYCDADPAPLEEAVVTITSNSGLVYTLETDAAGYYTFWLDELDGPYTVEVTYPEHETGLATGVVIVGGATTTVDFDLRWLVPCLAVDPDSMAVTLDLGASATLPMTLTNSGAGDASWEITERDEGYIPALTGKQVTVDVPAGAAKAPADTAVAAGAYTARPARSYTIEQRAAPLADATVLLLNADIDNDYGSPIQQLLLAYGDLVVDLYDARYATPSLAELEAYDVVIVWANYTFADATGMGNVLADYVDGGGKVIDMNFAIDPNWGYQGRFRTEGYSAMTISGTSYTYSCLGDYDPSHPVMEGVTNVCENYYRGYGTALTADSYEIARWQDNELFVAAKEDQSVVTIADYPGYYYQWTGQLDLVMHNAIFFLMGGGDVPWLSEDPTSGTVPPNGNTQVVAVTFDANAVGQPGEYLATLKVGSNDPVNDPVEVPVSMFVNAPEWYGKLEGTVTGLGYCDADPAPLEEAVVVIESSGGMTWTVMTDEFGYYSYWLDEAGSPYGVMVTYPDHSIGYEGVIIVGQQTTTQDFDLRWLVPCLAVDPDSLAVTLDLGDSVTLPMTLTNNGAGDASFEVSDQDEGFVPTAAAGEKPVAVPVGQPVVPQGASSDAPVQPFVARINQEAILHITTTDTSQSVERALNELGYAYDYYYGTPWTGIDFSPYDIVIVGMDGGLAEIADIQKLRTDVIDQGKRLIFLGGTCYQPFAQGMNDYLVQNDVNNYCWQVTNPPQWTLVDPGHPLADGLPDSYNYNNYYAGYYSIRVNDPDAETVAINGENHPAFFRKEIDGSFIWFIDSAYSYYWSDQADFDMFKQIVLNSIVAGGGDAVWLTEDPTSGVIPGYWPVTAAGNQQPQSSVAPAENPATGLSQFGESNVTKTGPIVESLAPAQSLIVDQAPNQTNGVFSDVSCDLCGGPQVVADNFNLSVAESIAQIVFWTGYYPNDVPIDPDHLTVIFHLDSGGLPGAAIYSESEVAYSREQTGVVLFGVHEYMHTLTFPVPVLLDPGSYWVEIYNDTGFDTDDMFWEVGDPDVYGNGQVGTAFAFEAPGTTWYFDGSIEFALQLVRAEEGGGNTQVIDVTFDANMVGQPGEYLATIKVSSNDPVNDPIEVPASMTVIAPDWYGKLEGTVTGLGYCDADPAPLEEAEVVITDNFGYSWTVMTDEFGYYSYWLDEAGSPYSVTVNYPDHSTGYADGVIIVGQETTTQDFDLRWLVPCLTVDPASLETTLDLGATETLPLELTNTGAGAADFELKEQDEGYLPLVQDTVLVVAYDSYNYVPMETALTTLGVPYVEVSNSAFEAMPVDDLLGYMAVFYGGGYAFDNWSKMVEYLDAGGKLYISDNDLGWSWGSHVFYTQYLQATYNTDNGGDILTGYDIMDGLTVNASTDPYPDGFTVGAEGVEIFTFDWGYAGGVKVERNDYVAIYTAWDLYYTTAGENLQVIERVVEALGPSDAPWLSEDPTAGTVDPDGGTLVVDVTFDAAVVTQPGSYHATLKVKSNDPVNDPIEVPVTMNVNAPPDYGRLEGIVTSLGYCDVYPAPMVEELVVITSSSGVTWTQLTNDVGYYGLYLPQDGSPYTVSVAPVEHEPGYADGVVIVGQQTTTLNFDLRWLAPCVSSDPTEFSVDVPEGYTLTENLELINNGAKGTEFEIGEKPATPGNAVAPAPVSPVGDRLELSPSGLSRPTRAAQPWAPSGDVELLLDDGSAEDSIGLTAGGQFIWFNRFTPTEDEFPLVIDQISLLMNYTTDVGASLQLLVYEDTDGDGDPGTNAVLLGYEYVTVQYNDMMTWNVYDLAEPVEVAGPGDVLIAVVNRSGASGLLDYPAAIDQTPPSQYRSWVGYYGDNPPEEPTFPAPQLWGVIDDYGLPGNWTLRASGYVGSTDVPWLSEDPITGTLEADSFFDIAVTFDSMTYTVGTYQAFLKVKTDDQYSPLEIPVTMNVVPVDYGVDAMLEDDALSGAPGETVTYHVVVTNTGNVPDVFDVAVSGDEWTTEAPASVALGPHASTTVDVTVEIPADAADGDWDEATCTFTSQGDPTESAAATMTTTAEIPYEYGVELTPATDAESGAPGETVEYVLQVTNTGNVTDTFDVTFASLEGWTVLPSVTEITLGAGETDELTVQVTIPADAADGDSDVATVTVTSQGDDSKFAVSELTTTAVIEEFLIFLPVTFVEFTP